MFCSVFALEGLFGMVPAIYMDVTQDGSKCNSTQTLSMSIEGYVAAHLLLQVVYDPYLIWIHRFTLSIDIKPINR